MNDILITIRQKAALLKVALEACQTALAAHHAARQAWDTDPTSHNQHTALALATSEDTWDEARDRVISKAQSLLDTTHVLLRLNPPRSFIMLSQQVATMQAAFDREVVAFTRYTKASGEEKTVNREVWQSSKGHCIQAAFHLMFEAARVGAAAPSDSQNQIDTDLDGSTPHGAAS